MSKIEYRHDDVILTLTVPEDPGLAGYWNVYFEIEDAWGSEFMRPDEVYMSFDFLPPDPPQINADD